MGHRRSLLLLPSPTSLHFTCRFSGWLPVSASISVSHVCDYAQVVILFPGVPELSGYAPGPSLQKGALSGQHGRFLQVSTTSGFTLSPASTLAWESVLSLTDEMAQQCVNCRLIATNLLPWKTSTGHRHSRVTSLESQTLQSSRLATFLCISTVFSWLRSRTRCRIIVRHRRVIWVAPSLWSTKGALHEKTAVFSRN